MSADSLSRIVAAALSDSLGVPVIVDAKPGAGGNIASEFVSRATPDRYTIILLTGGHAVSVALYRKLRFHPVDSFDFISLVSTFPLVVATRADGPLSSGPTLFLAPAPIAWQAMHLLNDVLPAATSCAADAAAGDAMTTNTPSVNLFIVCSSWFRGLALRQFVA